MSHRTLTLLLCVQTVLMALLVADRLLPVAHATGPAQCEITNWPDALAGVGFAAVRVNVEQVKTPVPVVVRDWDTTDEVRVSVRDWSTSDRVQVESR